MTYGLYLGVGFIFVIMFFHLIGDMHYPGDKSGWLNAALMGFFMVYSARKYQKEFLTEPVTYRLAFRMAFQLSFYSTVILGFFLYWYYGYIAEGGISNFIDLIEVAFAESAAFPAEQQEVLLEMYRTGLTAGTMSFACAMSQFFLGFALSLVVPFILRATNQTQIKTN